MLRRLSISARLLVLSVTLLVIIVGSNLYFTAALREAAIKAADADRVVRQIQVADSVRTAFSDLRYWRTDVALSLLMMSQRNADAARLRLDQQLERLATVNAVKSRMPGNSRSALSSSVAAPDLSSGPLYGA